MENLENQIGSKTANGMLWKFLEKISVQGMQLIIQIVLARLLMPEEYGLVGLLAIFISICDVFILQGLTTALIQKKNADDIDYSSFFFANIVVSLILYGILFVCAPLIASFYKEPALVSILRVLSINVVVGAFAAVHNAILSRQMDFRKSFFRKTADVITQGAVGVTMAVFGFGAWAMVFSKVAGLCVGTVVLWLGVRWTPKPVFSAQRTKSLFSFSSKVLFSNLLNTTFNNIHSLIIGGYYSAADVGYYQRGQQIPQTAMGALDGSMTEVLYPAFSNIQGDLSLLKKAVRKSIRLSVFVVFPVLLGLLVVSQPLTLILLTEKWLPSVPFMQLTCICCMFWPLSHRTHALNAIGKSSVTAKLSIIGKSITLLSIFVCLQFGIYAIMLGTIVSSSISLFITSYYTKKYIGYGIKELAQDMLPPLALSCIMAVGAFLIGLLNINIYVSLVLQILVGVAIYVLGAWLFKMDSFYFILNYIKRFVKR